MYKRNAISAVIGLGLMMAAGHRRGVGGAAVAEPGPQETRQAAPQEPQTAVAAPASTAVATIDFGEDAGKGLEGADRDSFAIPFLAILQPLSPQVANGEIEGAKAGKFMNTVTNDLYDEPLVIPCAFQRRYIRWAPRASGGGFKGELTVAQVNELRERGTVKELDGRLYFPDEAGNVNPDRCDRLSDTRSHFVLIVASPQAEFGVPAVLSLTSTGIKVSKNWLSRIDGLRVESKGKLVQAPSFASTYKVTTEKKQNDKGIWWQPIITPAGLVANPALYAQAKAFYAQVSAGKVEVAHDTLREDGENSAGSSDAPRGGF